MEVMWGSALVVASTVLLCELLRTVCRMKLKPGLPQQLLFEVISTFQLCCCVRELALLGSKGGLDPLLSLGFTYLQTILHCLTAQAACSPCGSLQQWLLGDSPAEDTLLLIGAQFLGAELSRVAMPALWTLSLSPMHERGDEGCSSPLHVIPLYGAGVEMLCTVCLILLLSKLDRVKDHYRPHLVALLITGLVYAGGHLTGAVFNPALALSIVFSCEGSTLLQYIFVYWIGPVIGVIVSILLINGGIPILAPEKRITQAKKSS
ncbi:aquaporin-11 [Pelodytes ibericus]